LTGEALPFEEAHAPAFAREHRRRRAAGRPTADDDHVGVHQRSARRVMVQVIGRCYRPVNLGSRFSTNALTASRWSSVRIDCSSMLSETGSTRFETSLTNLFTATLLEEMAYEGPSARRRANASASGSA